MSVSLEPCVQGIDDTDLYKASVQKAYLEYCPDAEAVLEFNDRRPHNLYNDYFLGALKEQIKHIGTLRTENATIDHLSVAAPWLGSTYLEWLRNWRPCPDLVQPKLDDGRLKIRIAGPVPHASPWEIYLMSTVSELNFRLIQKDWNMDGQFERATAKARMLQGLYYSEFGTRRRRSWAAQDLVVQALVDFEEHFGPTTFVGTSNIRLARKYGIKCHGTYPHEWVQAISALESLRYANRYSMKIWQKIFDSRLGTALPDTFGTASFLRDFDHTLARLFDGVRHDSGDPIEFAMKIIAHYKSLNIDPTTKSIIFSDNLNPQRCREIASILNGLVRVAFGIGTNFSNDFDNSPALNMVIKLVMLAGINVVKLSDTPSKAIGEKEALAIAKNVHLGIPLMESLAA
jgi:nicotinate phosphoribosyltransferase